MDVVNCASLFVILCSGVVVQASLIVNFIANYEELTKLNNECKQTVREQKQLNANLTNKMVEVEDLQQEVVSLNNVNSNLQQEVTSLKAKMDQQSELKFC